MPPRAVSPLILIAVLYAAGLGAAGQYSKLAVPFSALGAAYPDAGAALGWLVSVLSLLGLILGLMAGVLVARFGFRRSLVVALWAGAALSALQALLPPLPVMLALRMLEGGAHLAIVVAAPTLIAQVAPDSWRGAALTLWGTFFGVAFTVTALIGLPLVARAGLPALLALHGVAMAAVALILTRLLPADQGNAAAPLPHPLREHLEIYRSPRLAAPALGWLFYATTYVALLAVLPATLSEGAAATFSALAPLTGIVLSMTLGVALLTRVSAVTVVVAGFALALAAIPLILLAPESPWPGIAVFTALGLVQGASFAAVAQLNESLADRARANGAMAQLGNAGNLIGTPVMLLALGLAGTGGLVALAGLAYGLGIALHVILAERRRAQPH